jgi:hypothetical protein
VTLEERKEIQTIVVAMEADAMTLGFEARQYARRQTERLRALLTQQSERDTIPAPGPLPTPVPPSQEITT